MCSSVLCCMQTVVLVSCWGKLCGCTACTLYTTQHFRLLLVCAPLSSADIAFDNTRHRWLITLKEVFSCAQNHFWDDNCKNGPFISNLWFLNSYPLNLIIMSGWRRRRGQCTHTCKNEWSRWEKQKRVCTGNSGMQETAYLCRYGCTSIYVQVHNLKKARKGKSQEHFKAQETVTN